MLLDENGKVVMWNEAAQELLGYTEEEATGKAAHEVLQGEDRFGNMFFTQAVMQMRDQDRPIKPFELHARAKDGTLKPLLCTVLTFRGKKPEQSLLLYQFNELKAHSTPVFLQTFVTTGVGPVDGGAWKRDREERSAPISRREKEVLSLLAQGHNTVAIGKQLKISQTTVRNHIQNLLQKLGVHSRLEAIVFAFRNGLV